MLPASSQAGWQYPLESFSAKTEVKQRVGSNSQAYSNRNKLEMWKDRLFINTI